MKDGNGCHGNWPTNIHCILNNPAKQVMVLYPLAKDKYRHGIQSWPIKISSPLKQEALHSTVDIVLFEHDTWMCWSHFATTRLVHVRENTNTLKMVKPRDRKDITGPQN